MVFTKLSAQDKDAFFALLDEYFESRPEIFGQSSGTGISTTAAASAVQRVFSAANTTGSTASSAPLKSNNPYASSLAANVDVAQAIPTLGRVAAASRAFSGGGGGGGSSSLSSLPPPSLPRRALSNVPGSEVDKLVAKKTGVLSSFKNAGATGGGGGGLTTTTTPPAFSVSRNTFGPPPVRRVTSETDANAGASASAGAAGGAQRTRAAPEPEPDVEAGEWAEVLYDYSSEDAGDLAIEAGTRVFVTARSSEDWWTGRIEGQDKEGLFPASYVKLL